MTTLFDPLSFSRGPQMRNRFMMGPLTNVQSPDDGHMSEDEFNWLEMRTHGGFGRKFKGPIANAARREGIKWAGAAR